MLCYAPGIEHHLKYASPGTDIAISVQFQVLHDHDHGFSTHNVLQVRAGFSDLSFFVQFSFVRCFKEWFLILFIYFGYKAHLEFAMLCSVVVIRVYLIYC